MSRDDPELPDDGALLSATLKSLRRYRKMTKAETAAAMRIAIRTYARFEAGETRLNLDYIHRFAAATPEQLLATASRSQPDLLAQLALERVGLTVEAADPRDLFARDPDPRSRAELPQAPAVGLGLRRP